MNPSAFRPLLAGMAAALLAACAAAPPRLPPPALDARAPLPASAGDMHAAWPAADWWARYRDPTLDALMARALAGAPSLAQAQARVAQARAAIAAQAASGNAYVGASADLQRQRISEHGLFPVQFLGFTWYSQAD
ncbi:MAG: RND transporter, partial [Thermomonas haemolytica]